MRQKKVKDHIKSLHTNKYISDGMDTAASLEGVFKIIRKLARQARIAHRGDPHKVEFLASTVAGYDWTKEPLAHVSTQGLNFQQFYGKL